MFRLTSQSTITYEYNQCYHGQSEVFLFLSEASRYYPSFYEWYFEKVMPGVQKGDRKIISEIRDGKIAGIAILKNTIEEKKICTLRIAPNYQNRGIGVRLFKKSFEILQTNKPLLTVSEEKLAEFHKIFSYFNFEETDVIEGKYRVGKKEYIFNGDLCMKELL